MRQHKLHIIVTNIDWVTPHGGDVLPDTEVVPISFWDLEDEGALSKTVDNHLSHKHGRFAKRYDFGWCKESA